MDGNGRDPWNPQQRSSSSSSSSNPRPTMNMMGAIPRRSRPPPKGPSSQQQGGGNGSGGGSAMPSYGKPAAVSSSSRPRSLTAAIPRRSISKGMSSNDVPIPRRNSHESSNHNSTHMSTPKIQIPLQHHSQGHTRSSSSRQPAQRTIPSKRSSASRGSTSSGGDTSPRPEAFSPPPTINGVSIQSEDPFIIHLDLQSIPLGKGGISKHRSSSRTPKRKRPTYQELQDTDSDDFLSDSDEEKGRSTKKGGRLKTKKASGPAAPPATTTTAKPKKTNKHETPSLSASNGPTEVAATEVLPATTTPDQAVPAVESLALHTTSLDAPPPGTLTTLWYSRECFLHVFVLEKVLAWKTRPVTKLEWDPEYASTSTTEGNGDSSSHPPTTYPEVDASEAARLSSLALNNPTIWNDQRKRMEVSRLHPELCPLVLQMAAAKEYQDTNGKPKFRTSQLVDHENELNREDVYLVKWRGRSHLHNSWERGSDLIKFDQSNNTARHKIRRFVQSQELAFGKGWKKMLDEERKTVAAIHAGSGADVAGTSSANNATPPAKATGDVEEQGEEYFPPACTEIERILACDESEMDLKLFAKQRALNIQAEQEALKQRELPESQVKKWNSQENLEVILKGLPWDPEDNVRYVVKWKGLPFAELTWEYWRDIKRDAVDDAEDFWYRQQPPPQEVIKNSNKPHPHIREFRKIQESPAFGLSKRERPIAKLTEEDGDVPAQDEEDGDSNPGFRLRTYQLEGVNWLLFNWWNRRSCILADEMGLGKTIQSVCFLRQLQELPNTCIRGPFLIVAPLSLIGQWQSETETWAPDLNVLLYHGSADARDFLVKQEFYYTEQFMAKGVAMKLKKQHVTKFHILITTYEVVLKDINVISKIKWRTLIVDEAHRLKNSKSRLFEELATVPRDYCVLLTGTPLANATEELWALLHFADPVSFASKDDFLEKFGQLTAAKQVNELHNLLKPYLLRRVKEDVEKSLPPKEETILEVALTPIQKKYYKAIYERNTAFLYKGAKPSNSPSLMNVMMELRKCCNHPYLVRGAEERILSDAASSVKEAKGSDAPLDYAKLFGEQLVKSSGKMVLIAKLLPKLFSNGHKVLIFSQMVRVLDLLEELLRLMKYRYERLDGSTSSSSRAAAVDRFTRKSCKRFVMLLSTRAGGLGLNLTAADIVIIFDSDWNPQNDLQAMARAHRIGQTRAVRVYRLLTAKTYEMHMFHSASMKLGLERAVLSQQRDQGEDGEEGKQKPKSDREAQAKEIDELLKKGAYDVFRDDDDGEAEKFMETDIDQLLERSSKTVTYDAKETNLSSGLGSFSKASFVADTGDGEKDVDLDDPDFWSKAVGLDAPVETSEEISQMIDDGVKRSRKQVQVFDPYAEFAEAEQRKKDKIALKIKEEKEEKERLRLAKKKKKRDEKDRKKREREEIRGSLFNKSSAPSVEEDDDDEQTPKKESKEPKAKKAKKGADRKRALRRAENADPVLEKLKQAWDVAQRNRFIAATLRFGFSRFCKIRNESNLTSLPIQDLEVFARSYFFQLALQVAVTLLSKLHFESASFSEGSIRTFLGECLGSRSEKELEWICDGLLSTMQFYKEVECGRRFLRIPLTLAEPTFIAELRKGSALRSLRRIFMLGRLQRVVEDCLDDILSALGHEELGKRGCPTSDISTMDADLKARLVTTEELSLAVSRHLRKVNLRAPGAWWDRSCDVSLIIGTFVHGLGNYEAMQSDEALPFSYKIRKFSAADQACSFAQQKFNFATKACRRVFDDALESAKAKAQEEVHAAVAAAAAASSEREKDAVALREGGAAATAVLSSMPEATVNLVSQDMDDSHFVTLPRLQRVLIASLREDSLVDTENLSKSDGNEVEGGTGSESSNEAVVLPMPDARVLDYRLNVLLSEIERNGYSESSTGMDIDLSQPATTAWSGSVEVMKNIEIRNRALSHVLHLSSENPEEKLCEYWGVGISGTQCGASHRSLDDGTDFSIGAASSELSQVAYGSDAPRYLRAIGVPMNLTRYAISALVHADENCVKRLLADERRRSDSISSNARDEQRPIAAVKIKEEESEKATSRPDSVGSSAGDDKVEGLKDIFDRDSNLRGAICVVVLHYGMPSANNEGQRINKSLWRGVREQCGLFDDSQPDSLFSLKEFRKLVQKFYAGSDEVPTATSIEKYVHSRLLPHCLRLCVMGNGPTTRNARGSKGQYDTAFGTSTYPEYSMKVQSPLPDPCLEMGEQSIEAVACALAILRRVRIMRSSCMIAGGKLSITILDEVLRSSYMRKSMDGLPVWWCPWIHDAALLMHASTKGLFAIIRDRTSEEDGSIAFRHTAIVQHMYTTFVADENALPRSIIDESPPEDVTAWIEMHAKEFPSANVLERRLAFLCAKSTENFDGNERYDSLPMFDHGGWPRN